MNLVNAFEFVQHVVTYGSAAAALQQPHALSAAVKQYVYTL